MTERMATEPMKRYVANLLAQRDATGTPWAAPAWQEGIENPATGEKVVPIEFMTFVNAREAIEQLKRLPYKPREEAKVEVAAKLEPGFYFMPSAPAGSPVIVRMVQNKAKTGVYAKVLQARTTEPVQCGGGHGHFNGEGMTEWCENPQACSYFPVETKVSWEYESGFAFRNELAPLTVEVAAALGKQFGVCIICCKTLSETLSVAAGIGPVCAEKLGVNRKEWAARAALAQVPAHSCEEYDGECCTPGGVAYEKFHPQAATG